MSAMNLQAGTEGRIRFGRLEELIAEIVRQIAAEQIIGPQQADTGREIARRLNAEITPLGGTDSLHIRVAHCRTDSRQQRIGNVDTARHQILVQIGEGEVGRTDLTAQTVE